MTPPRQPTDRSSLSWSTPRLERAKGCVAPRRSHTTCGNAAQTADIVHTTARGDAARITTEAAARTEHRPWAVVACGGDGTIQEVAGALARARAEQGCAPVLGLSPAGRCNDFARALSISRQPADIARVLLEGDVKPVDLGRVNDRYFCSVATMGIDAAVSSYVDTMRLPLKGTIAYVYGAVRVLLRYKPCRIRIEGPFGKIDKAVFLASSANTSSYGGAIPIVPQAVPTDGHLDLCVIGAISKLRALWVIPIVMLGRHRKLRGVSFYKADRLTIESDTPLDMWADGEAIAHTPVTIEVVPDAVEVALPSPRPVNE